MNSIKFKECNIVYAENQPQYTPLPGFKNESVQGEFITCWKLSFKERLRVLFLGKIWKSQMTFNNPLQPMFLTTKKHEVLTTNN